MNERIEKNDIKVGDLVKLQNLSWFQIEICKLNTETWYTIDQIDPDLWIDNSKNNTIYNNVCLSMNNIAEVLSKTSKIETAQEKFKVGDKVKIIKSDYTHDNLSAGNIATIAEFREDTQILRLIGTISKGEDSLTFSGGLWFYPEDIEPIVVQEQTKESIENVKVGDTVKVIDDNWHNFQIGDVCKIIKLQNGDDLYKLEQNKSRLRQWLSREQFEILNTSEVEILHLFDRNNRFGGLTIAYKYKQGARVIEIATAVCSPKDQYTKKVGRKIATDNFQAGKTVLIPIAKSQLKYNDVVGQLRDLFQPSTYWGV